MNYRDQVVCILERRESMSEVKFKTCPSCTYRLQPDWGCPACMGTGSIPVETTSQEGDK